jgi:hypothetical protein
MTEQELRDTHRHSSYHRKKLEASSQCGCFYCEKIFNPIEIVDWTDGGQTAICPYCGIDSVIGSASVPITEKLLQEMRILWF